jgi:hypothetical protein
MVHALQEVWRVLKPAGIVIDQRPISVDVPLLILTVTGWQSAGLPDQSPDRVHDVAADRAMRIVIHERLFIRLKQKYFGINNYWNNLKDFKMDVEEEWKEDVIISEEIWRRVHLLYRSRGSQKRIRITIRRKLAMYQKSS